MDYPGVGIVIVNWNGWRDTQECLEAVYRQSYRNLAVVVVDNGSTDGSAQRIKEWAKGREVEVMPDPGASERIAAPAGMYRDGGESKRMFLIEAATNLGFAGGSNAGMKLAALQGAEYLLLLNNDAFFRSADTLARMVEFMEKTPSAGACGPRLLYPDGLPQQSYGHFPTMWRTMAFLYPLYKLLPSAVLNKVKRSNVVPEPGLTEPMPVDWPSGACLLVRREVIEEIGMLDERFFLYMEETDWCLRMEEVGWERYCLPQVEVFHRFGGSVATSSRSMRSHHLESQFSFFGKHFSKAAFSCVIAGFLIRSLWALLLIETGNLLSAQNNEQRSEQEKYWRFAFTLSIRALTGPVAKQLVPFLRSAPPARHA